MSANFNSYDFELWTSVHVTSRYPYPEVFVAAPKTACYLVGENEMAISCANESEYSTSDRPGLRPPWEVTLF